MDRSGSGDEVDAVDNGDSRHQPDSTMTGWKEAADGGSRGCQVCGAWLLDDEVPGPGHGPAPRAASDAPLDSPDPAALEELALAGRLEVVDEGADDAPGGPQPAVHASRAAAADGADSHSEPAGFEQDSGSGQDREATAASRPGCRRDQQSLCSASEAEDATIGSLPPRQTDAEWFTETPNLKWDAPGPDAVLLGASLALLAILSVATRTCG